CLGNGREIGRHGRAINHERMVPRRLEGSVDAAKDTAALMLDQRKLAVDRHWGPHNLAAEGLADRLVAKADAEDRNGPAGPGYELQTDARVIRRTRPRRQHNRLRVCRHHLTARYLVVAMDGDLRPAATEIVEQGEGEAVVVVNEDDHGSRARSSS